MNLEGKQKETQQKQESENNDSEEEESVNEKSYHSSDSDLAYEKYAINKKTSFYGIGDLRDIAQGTKSTEL